MSQTYAFVYFALALIYIATMSFHPYWGEPIVKILSIVWLRASVRISLKRYHLLMLALTFSLAGDVILALDKPAWFVFGLGAFLIAHIIYCAIFLPLVQKSTRAFIFAGGAFALAFGVTAWLFPSLQTGFPDLLIPVCAYISVIATMAGLAAFVSPTVFVGALIFMASDSAIAINKFKTPFEWAPYFIMITYYIAQFLIVQGTIARLKNEAVLPEADNEA